jgi:phage terminase large subunit
VDVARFGKDNSVFMLWEGLNLYRVEICNGLSTDSVADKIAKFCKEEKIPYSHVVVDEDGVGGGVVDQCRGVKGFINNSTALDNMNARKDELMKQNFVNLKTQCTYLMSERVNSHEIEVSFQSPEVQEALSQELEVIRRKEVDNDNMKLSLISKDDIKQIIGRSPDLSDAFMMRMYFGLKREYRNSGDFEARQKEQARVNSQFMPFDRWKIG